LARNPETVNESAQAVGLEPADEGTTKFAMKLFMGSWTFSFVALIAAYLVLRFNADIWPPEGLPRPPFLLTGISTFAAIGASVMLQIGVARRKGPRPEQVVSALAFAALLGTIFLALQGAAAMQAIDMGLIPTRNAYTAIFWLTAVFHAVHVLVGVGALVYLWARARESMNDRRMLGIELWTYYWHSIDVAWLAIFLVMFVPY